MKKVLLSIEDFIVPDHGYPDASRINLKIREGGHLALVGDNEAGKSILLNVIAGKRAVFQGKVNFSLPGLDGQPIWQKPIAHISVRHSFKGLKNDKRFYYQQRYNASDADNSQKVEEYLSAIKSFRQKPYWTLNKVMEALQMEPLLRKELIKLSNGETKRVLLAAALLQNPLLLIIDNPFAGVDLATRNMLHQLITEIGASGITIIMTTSEYEIPEAIRHVAMWSKKEPLRILKKQNFTPPILKLNNTPIPIKPEALLKDHTDAFFNNIIDMKNVSVQYGNEMILEDINWTVNQGERWAVLGPNGAGKSTLLSLINGDNPQAYANDITLFDKKRGTGESIWSLKEKIGFLSPELFQYFPGNMVCEEIILTGFYDKLVTIRKKDAAKIKVVRQWMELFDINALSGKRFNDIPITAQRFCLLARAMIKKPSLLILDEPFQGFNTSQVQYFKNMIDSICSHSQMTLLFVTHYKQEIPSCVTHTLRLKNGRQEK